ncbi:MAG: hypothetical protein LBG59_04025 [Candidatus Peribacteria bacterium]|jgi:hypothetical protein|nr:hypothetical protein [Candidatus Peribacteria bacterium]
MPLSKQECQSKLETQFLKDFSQNDNISKLTTTARGADKYDCLSEMGNMVGVNSFLQQIKLNGAQHGAPSTQPSTSSNSSQSSAQPSSQSSTHTSVQPAVSNPFEEGRDSFVGGVKTVGYYLLILLTILIGLRILFILIEKACRYGYAFFNSHRLVFLKVLLPRGDGKSDREQEKELAKDMKEKIARMSQVFNNLHKMGEISTYEKIMGKIFGKQKLVLIYQYENGQINCLVGTYPEHQHMVESAIASQYAAASIERISRPKFFTKKYYDIEVLEPEKDSLYTIKLYKNIPDDPINNILDSIGKVSPEDTVNIIIVVKPESSNFNKRRQVAADRLYKNLDLYETKWRHRKNLLQPRKLFSFLFY